MRNARIIFRSEGAWNPLEHDPIPVMFDIDDAYRPTTTQDCAPLTDPICTYLAQRCQLGAVQQVWFSVQETMNWARRGQEIIIDGGALVGTRPLRFRVELHYEFCNCAYCREEHAYRDLSTWL